MEPKFSIQRMRSRSLNALILLCRRMLFRLKSLCVRQQGLKAVANSAITFPKRRSADREKRTRFLDFMNFMNFVFELLFKYEVHEIDWLLAFSAL
jgi:hypothetical protein